MDQLKVLGCGAHRRPRRSRLRPPSARRAAAARFDLPTGLTDRSPIRQLIIVEKTLIALWVPEPWHT